MSDKRPVLSWIVMAAAAIALLLPPTAGRAQQTVAHSEACLRWSYVDGLFGSTNNCDKPVTITFALLSDGCKIERSVAPNGRFNSGAAKAEIEGGWIFTACPVGYAPNVPFSIRNKDPILQSLYNCVRRPGA